MWQPSDLSVKDRGRPRSTRWTVVFWLGGLTTRSEKFLGRNHGEHCLVAKYKPSNGQRPDPTVASCGKMSASRFYQLKTSHALIGQYLKWIKSRPAAGCGWCHYACQTRDHLFRWCPKWKLQQRTLWEEGCRSQKRRTPRARCRSGSSESERRGKKRAGSGTGREGRRRRQEVRHEGGGRGARFLLSFLCAFLGAHFTFRGEKAGVRGGETQRASGRWMGRGVCISP